MKWYHDGESRTENHWHSRCGRICSTDMTVPLKDKLSLLFKPFQCHCQRIYSHFFSLKEPKFAQTLLFFDRPNTNILFGYSPSTNIFKVLKDVEEIFFKNIIHMVSIASPTGEICIRSQ